ncbi:MAG: hypothetical protein PHV66_10400 [Bacteroidales bacterium]|nr:hypothetical protein [Bacteroidales bacterium]
MHISCLVLGFSYFLGLLTYTHRWITDHSDAGQVQIVQDVLSGEDHLVVASSDTYDSSFCFVDMDAVLVSTRTDITYYPVHSSLFIASSRSFLPVAERSSLFCRPPPVC